ncbi:MAG: hypothetical protein V5A72_02185 [Candidatus Nanohaloarchaea archaeon]
MKHWHLLILDPGHYAVLKNLEEGKTITQIDEEIGIKKERARNLLQNLTKEKLVSQEIEGGVRKFRKKDLDSRLSSLKNELKSKTIGGTREAIDNGEFSKARDYLKTELPIEGVLREKTAKLEAAEKLAELT